LLAASLTLDLLAHRCVANACADKGSDLKASVMADKLKTEENNGDVVMQE
jgi:hypothetical protein